MIITDVEITNSEGSTFENFEFIKDQFNQNL